MIYEASPIAIALFFVFVAIVLGISFYFGRKTKSASGYFAAGGTIHWAVNGIAFAGDYLSAASFLGICGMIAFYGYDGFLYSIGYLAGWIVALFVVAEPMKRLGRFTFTDALDSRFNSKAIQLVAAISTLIVSIFYLIPQMVGAGALVTPLLGLPHWMGVTMVGAIVIFIVATAGMTSTTYVQFLKGGLLIVFSLILTVSLISNGINLIPSKDYHKFKTLNAVITQGKLASVTGTDYKVSGKKRVKGKTFIELDKGGVKTWWQLKGEKLVEALSITKLSDGKKLYNGEPKSKGKFYSVGHANKVVVNGKEVEKSGALGPFEFLSTIERSEIVRFSKVAFKHQGKSIAVYFQNPTPGKRIMRPGLKFKVDKGATWLDRLNFISLMLA
ncbi:MAG: cation acetate symporter, partial [Deltaproteobacteria bacterium]|nr:cation acetate symporter [Deltaproteobacteria bacterium]